MSIACYDISKMYLGLWNRIVPAILTTLKTAYEKYF